MLNCAGLDESFAWRLAGSAVDWRWVYGMVDMGITESALCLHLGRELKKVMIFGHGNSETTGTK